MKEKVYMTELPCYPVQLEKTAELKRMEKHAYDFGILPEESLRKELWAFVHERAKHLSFRTIDTERLLFHVICRFLKERHPKAKTFQTFEEETLVRQLKAWLLQHGYTIVGNHYMKNMGRSITKETENIKYLRKVFAYFKPKDTRAERIKDIWELQNLEYPVQQNPISPVKAIRFNEIIQPAMRAEVKEACYIRLRYLAVGTVIGDIRAIKRLSGYLREQYPKMQSFGELTRVIMEEYFTYIHTEVTNKKYFKTELSHLKAVLQEIGKIIEKPHLQELFLIGDKPKAPSIPFRYYSDETIKNLNSHIVRMDEQIARALILHQMLGTRISDTLTLRPDCLYKEGTTYIVRIYQVKTRYYEKPVSEEVAALIEKSIAYTKSRYGDTKYVFVCENDVSKPYQYAMLKSRVMSLIHEQDIRDDNGELLGFGTHLFRHCYGVKLADMNLDDYTIARLLGHKTTRSVHHYRKVSGKVLEKETREVREKMDEILGELIRRWEGYEQVFQNG